MIKSNNDWAEEQFGHAKLGDPRRTARLVKMASDLAQHPGKSVVKSSPSPASMEVLTGLFATIMFPQTILLRPVLMQQSIKFTITPSFSR